MFALESTSFYLADAVSWCFALRQFTGYKDARCQMWSGATVNRKLWGGTWTHPQLKGQ